MRKRLVQKDKFSCGASGLSAGVFFFSRRRKNHTSSFNFYFSHENVLQFSDGWLFCVWGHKATEKMTLITKPAAAYILLHKIIFIDAI